MATKKAISVGAPTDKRKLKADNPYYARAATIINSGLLRTKAIVDATTDKWRPQVDINNIDEDEVVIDDDSLGEITALAEILVESYLIREFCIQIYDVPEAVVDQIVQQRLLMQIGPKQQLTERSSCHVSVCKKKT
jgi:hypothetical protein